MNDSLHNDHDVPNVVNRRVVALVADFVPLQSAVPPPGAFADGDVLVAMTSNGMSKGIVRLTNPAPTPGPGVMEVTLPGNARDGAPMLVWLYRTGGADGSVSVDYATADNTAIAGVDYQPANGTITFGTGEYLKSFSIPTLNDGLFAGIRQIALTLAPHGTTIQNGQTSFLANLYDSDPIPLLTMAPVTVPEGDASLHYADVPVTLSGARRATASAHWYGSGIDVSAPQNGTITFAPGDSIQTIRVGYRGNTTPEADRSITLYLDSEVNAQVVTRSISIQIQDDDLPQLSVADAAVLEGTGGSGGTMTFHVSLLIAGIKPVTVNYATVDGTARAGSDYTAASGTLTFAPGETSKNVSVAITPDAKGEGSEIFVLRLTSPVNATFARDTGTGTIIDDDGPAPPDAIVSIDDVSIPEGNADSFAAFTVTLAPARTDSVTVNYHTIDGTADSSDYTPSSGTIVFPAGQTTQKIFIPIHGDQIAEPDETFSVVLTTAAEGVTLAKDHATCTLRDDDTPSSVPILRMADVAVIETNGPTAAVFTVTLSQPVATDVTVQYATADGTASAPADYAAASGTLTIPAGSTAATITVVVNGDLLHESDETFHLSLTNASVAIATPSATATILDDDPLPIPKRRGAGH